MTTRDARRYALCLAAELIRRDIGVGAVGPDTGVAEEDRDTVIAALEALADSLERRAGPGVDVGAYRPRDAS